MRTIFVGGPGRSGTSFVADRLANHPDISSFRNVELKLFTEKNGLLDLWHSFFERYSPNRATVARQQFQRLSEALITGQFGQPGLKDFASAEDWTTVFSSFLSNASPSGEFDRTSKQQFRQACHRLLLDIARLSTPDKTSPRIFLEKTPHALLAADFLSVIAPGAGFIHIMRDPRSIAQSLRSMRWGPDDLGDCCAWVAGYCNAWLDAQKTAADLGLEIARYAIEDIAEHPSDCANGLCNAAGIDRQSDLFIGASAAVLNGWVSSVSEEDLALMNRRLSGWVHHFGYSSNKIGQRRSVETAEVPETVYAPDTPSDETPACEFL